MNTDEQTNTIDVNEYDLDTPETCPAPSGISKYRTQFLKALADATPEVLQILHDEVLPLVTELGVSEEWTDETFDDHVSWWGNLFHLNDPWLRDAAKLTLYQWNADPSAADDLLWASLPDTPTQVLSFPNREMQLGGLVWCVETEDWAQFKKRATDSFSRHLKAYKAGITDKLKALNFRPAPKLKETEHFVWLALYQVRGWSPSKISEYLLHEHAKDVSESGVLKAVRKKAKLIGLNLRPDNRGKGGKQRKVAPDRPRRFGPLPISITGLRKTRALSS